MRKFINVFLLVTTVLAFLLSGCNSTVQTPFSAPAATSTNPPDMAPIKPQLTPLIQTVIVTAAPGSTPTPEDPPFQAATYQELNLGISIEYPSGWVIDDLNKIGDRGSVIQLTSWQHAPGEVGERPAGESQLDISILNWDPKNDLEAYIAQRKLAWDASGMELLSEEEWQLAGNHRAVRYLVLAADKSGAVFFLLTTLGERYLVLSGSGNVDLLGKIARTLRVQSPQTP